MTTRTHGADDSSRQRLPGGGLLLTGVTGYLGGQLLHEVLETSDVSVTCLVRGENEQRARENLLRKLTWYFPTTDWARHSPRFRVVVGDVCEPELGLPKRAYEELAATHRVIINAAANVSHVGAASAFFRVNTESVARLIEFARRGLPKQLHHISTLSVSGHFKGEEAPPIAAFEERHLEEGQAWPAPYAESKHRAEVLMRQAFEAGLTGAVYRVGYIGPHSVSGRFQQNIHENFVASYVRACVRLGFAPYLPDVKVRVTPVDAVARGILTLMTRGETRGKTFHVETPHEATQYDIVRVLQAAGYPVRLLLEPDFLDRAPRLSQDAESLAALIPSETVHGVHVPIVSRETQAELTRLGFEFPRFTSAWLGKFIQHAVEVGFIEAPRFWSLAPVVPDLL
ncbi:MAG: thioester reductase domain-containing protein [Polyangiales bacterium]